MFEKIYKFFSEKRDQNISLGGWGKQEIKNYLKYVDVLEEEFAGILLKNTDQEILASFDSQNRIVLLADKRVLKNGDKFSIKVRWEGDKNFSAKNVTSLFPKTRIVRLYGCGTYDFQLPKNKEPFKFINCKFNISRSYIEFSISVVDEKESAIVLEIVCVSGVKFCYRLNTDKSTHPVKRVYVSSFDGTIELSGEYANA
jgi:NAD+--asparagine ADP-ribosyltransferase